MNNKIHVPNSLIHPGLPDNNKQQRILLLGHRLTDVESRQLTVYLGNKLNHLVGVRVVQSNSLDAGKVLERVNKHDLDWSHNRRHNKSHTGACPMMMIARGGEEGVPHRFLTRKALGCQGAQK